MAKGRELKGRIKSVENTRKITRTMEMVATSKMKRAQDRVVAARPYANALTEVISSLYSPELAERFPLLRQPAGKTKTAAVILLTSNRGLAGAFNSNLIKEARSLIAKLESGGAAIQLHIVGKKGTGYFKYVGRPIATSRIDITDRPTATNASELRGRLTRRGVRRVLQVQLGVVDAADQRSRAAGDATATQRTRARLPVVPLGRSDPHGVASGVRAQRGISRARRDRGRRAVGAAHGHEERHGQRKRDAERPAAYL
jgi:hypothetical protein